MKLEPISIGILRKGDLILMEVGHEKHLKMAKVKKVLFSGEHGEEIIYNKRKNWCFITSMVLNNTSWVKNVWRVVREKKDAETQERHQ